MLSTLADHQFPLIWRKYQNRWKTIALSLLFAVFKLHDHFFPIFHWKWEKGIFLNSRLHNLTIYICNTISYLDPTFQANPIRLDGQSATLKRPRFGEIQYREIKSQNLSFLCASLCEVWRYRKWYLKCSAHRWPRQSQLVLLWDEGVGFETF